MYNPFLTLSEFNTHAHLTDKLSSGIVCTDTGMILFHADGPVFSEKLLDILSVSLSNPVFIGSISEQNWVAYGVDANAPLPAGYRLVPLRSLFEEVSEDILSIAGRAVQLIRFITTTRYCGKCGAENELKSDELAKVCPSCGLLTFPRLSPAIIVRITDGARILLARSPQFPEGMYSVVAGFVEPGESLEIAVHREVFEEVGVHITDLKYFGSQPWPFPDSLMIGFVARYLSGDVRADGVEIADARWFENDALPELPGKISISRALIDDFLGNFKTDI
ncbi:MAG TPA: NAD(+) diphosphatase [Methanospirillum sp.]|nr:NAD(+) diphosphatase [Methanospirillum sp.]